MERKRQREIALAIIAAAVLGVAIYRVRSMSAGPSVPAGLSGAGTAAARTPQGFQPKKESIAGVNLAELNAPRPEPVDVTRNPFRFKPKPLPPPPPPAPVRAAPAVVQTGPVEPPPPPRIALKFIGRMDSEKAGQVAILSDGRGVYYGREGETIEGRYRIVRIGVESVELAYLDGRGRQTIRLTGQ